MIEFLFSSVCYLRAYFTETIKDLKICRISRQAGQAGGDDEVYLLCEKINKGQNFIDYRLKNQPSSSLENQKG